MNRFKIIIVCGVLLAVIIPCSLLLRTGRVEAVQLSTVVPHAIQASCGTWSMVPSPNPGPSDNALGAVTAISSKDVWAVGEFLRTGSSSIAQTLTEHWNGKTWLYIPSPNLGALGNVLFGVSGSSSNDVWAVGSYTDASTYLSRTLIEHWNGTKWSIVSSPQPGSSYDNLYSVTAISASDAWAVGFYRNDGDSNPEQTLIEHWDGKQWSAVSSPNPGSAGNLLYGISASSANNIWAVGQSFNSDPYQGLILHWDGSKWSVVGTPGTGSASNGLFAVSATGSSSAFGVGRIESDITPSTPLTEQWNGSAWSVNFSPSAGSSDNNLYGVTSISANDAWADGNYLDKGGNAHTLIEHWNGTQWNIVSSPSPGKGGDNILGGIVAVSAQDVWAVGGYDNGGSTHTLVEHYC